MKKAAALILLLMCSYLSFGQGYANYVLSRDSVGSAAYPTPSVSGYFLFTDGTETGNRDKRMSLSRLQTLIGGSSITAGNGLTDNSGSFDLGGDLSSDVNITNASESNSFNLTAGTVNISSSSASDLSFTAAAAIEFNTAEDGIRFNIDGNNDQYTFGSAFIANGIRFPNTDGTAGQVLTTNGAGVTSFSDPTGLGAGSGLTENSGNIDLGGVFDQSVSLSSSTGAESFTVTTTGGGLTMQNVTGSGNVQLNQFGAGNLTVQNQGGTGGIFIQSGQGLSASTAGAGSFELNNNGSGIMEIENNSGSSFNIQNNSGTMTILNNAGDLDINSNGTTTFSSTGDALTLRGVRQGTPGVTTDGGQIDFFTTPFRPTVTAVSPILRATLDNTGTWDFQGNNLTEVNTVQGTNAENLTLVSVGVRNVVLNPSGSGQVLIDGVAYPDQTGSNGDVLTFNGTNSATWETPRLPVFDANYTKPAGASTLDFFTNGGVVTHNIARTSSGGFPPSDHRGILRYNSDADVSNDTDDYLAVFYDDLSGSGEGGGTYWHRNYFEFAHDGAGSNRTRLTANGVDFYDAAGTTLEGEFSEFGARFNINHPSGGAGIYDDSFTSNNSIEFTDGPSGGTTFFRAGEILGTQVTTNADPDTNLTDAANGVIAYDDTDNELRGFVNGGWEKLSGQDVLTLQTFSTTGSMNAGVRHGNVTAGSLTVTLRSPSKVGDFLYISNTNNALVTLSANSGDDFIGFNGATDTTISATGNTQYLFIAITATRWMVSTGALSPVGGI